jgi:hypothetical protein
MHDARSMTFKVEVRPTESAAWLAAARVAANGGPTPEVRRTAGGWGLFVNTADEVTLARSILALFVR